MVADTAELSRKGLRSQENSAVSLVKLVYHLGNFSNHGELNTSRSLLLDLLSELDPELVRWKKQFLHDVFASSHKGLFS